MNAPTPPHRAWALWLITVLSVAAIGISVYMTRHHETQRYGGEAYQAEELVGCAEAEGVNCDIVNTSEWSEVFGVPTFTWAIPTYALIGVLAVLAARGQHRYKPALVGLGVAISAFSVFLFYISKVELGYVCLWCMRMYGVSFATLALALASGGWRQAMPGGKELGTAAALFAVFTGGAVGAQKAYRAQILGDAGAIQLDSKGGTAKSERDPTGPAPAFTFNITTEDGNPATISTQPDDAWKGNPNAKVAIIEFADFECGYCKRASFELHRLFDHYKDDVVFVFKHFPMNPKCNDGVQNMKHVDACNAAAASVCAQEQGKFWEMHDLLFKNNHQLKPDHITEYAKKIGLDGTKFGTCMSEGRGAAKVKANGSEGKVAQIHGTPRIFIQGQLYRAGQSAEQMAMAIETALGHTGADAQKNAAAMREAQQAAAEIPADVPEMRLIEYGGLKFYIDTFEAGLTDGKATSGKHQIPGVRMSWFAARDACQAAGKRMCTEQEWIAACQSAAPVDDDGDGQFADDLIEGNAYPFGDFHEPGRCWENHPNPSGAAGPPQWRPAYTGEMPACVSKDGVYDLTGNVEEWVGDAPAKAVLLGGAFDTPDDKARCYRRNDTFGAGYANMRTGFRCCKNP